MVVVTSVCRLLEGSEHSCGVPSDYTVRRHIAGDDGACPDNGSLADRDAAEDDRARTNGSAAPDASWAHRPVCLGLQTPALGRCARIVVVDEVDVMPNE